MTSSLVGSEMCIRDRHFAMRYMFDNPQAVQHDSTAGTFVQVPLDSMPVSYTHLTLPTICSV
eukprot:5464878-Prorocentrum_lima.AAC.1